MHVNFLIFQNTDLKHTMYSSWHTDGKVISNVEEYNLKTEKIFSICSYKIDVIYLFEGRILKTFFSDSKTFFSEH